MPEPGTGELITNAAPGIVGSHDIILQSLDSWRPYLKPDGTYEDRFYGSDMFQGTEPAWDTVPIIFGKKHPSTPFSINPAKALEESEGVIGGGLKDSALTTTGSPLLRANSFFIVPKMEQLAKEGKLSFSSGFISGLHEGKLTGVNGRVIPDHVLAFEHSRTNRPQDGAALILNSMGGVMPDEDPIKKTLTDFLAELKSLLVPAKKEPVMPAIPEPKGIMVPNMTETKIADLEAKLTEKDKMITNMTAEIDGYKKADETRKAAELETKWGLVKNSTSPGLYATPELETANRKEWETDPTAFLIKNAISRKQEETKQEGVQFIKNQTADDGDAEYLKFLNGDD